MSMTVLIFICCPLLFNMKMKTVEETRHDRLLMLRDEFGSVAELAKKLNKSYAQVSQWVNRSVSTRNGQPRSMNSETVRDVEIKTGKPRGWMDHPVSFDSLETVTKEFKISSDMSLPRIEAHQELENVPEEDLEHVKQVLKTYIGKERRTKPRSKRQGNSNKREM